MTTWSRYDNAWEGLSTRDLLLACCPRDDAHFVVLHSHDGYTTNLTLEDFAADDALLAHKWSDAPLTQEHGGPVRLVVPHLYFWKSAKWLQRIEFLSQMRRVTGKSAAITTVAIRGRNSAIRTIDLSARFNASFARGSRTITREATRAD